MSSEHTGTLSVFTAQTDLGMRSRTFSLKINKLPIFLKSLKPDNV